MVASTATQNDTDVRIAILRLRSGTTVLRERRSDGTERVTLVRRTGGGVGLGLGAEVGAGTWVLGGRVDGAVEARGASGRVWTAALRAARRTRSCARSPRARSSGGARRGARACVRGPLPPADVVFGDRGLGATIAGNLERVGLSLDAEDLFSTTTDRRTGERTLVIRRHSDLLGTLGVAGPLGAEAGLGRDDRAALVVDARGRPLRLAVTGIQRVQAGVQLPGPLRLLVGGRLPLREGRIVQTERRLDLSDPANLAAAGAYVRALRDPRIHLGGGVRGLRCAAPAARRGGGDPAARLRAGRAPQRRPCRGRRRGRPRRRVRARRRARAARSAPASARRAARGARATTAWWRRESGLGGSLAPRPDGHRTFRRARALMTGRPSASATRSTISALADVHELEQRLRVASSDAPTRRPQLDAAHELGVVACQRRVHT